MTLRFFGRVRAERVCCQSRSGCQPLPGADYPCCFDPRRYRAERSIHNPDAAGSRVYFRWPRTAGFIEQELVRLKDVPEPGSRIATASLIGAIG